MQMQLLTQTQSSLVVAYTAAKNPRRRLHHLVHIGSICDCCLAAQ